MKKSIFLNWIEHLRSNNYTQIFGKLHNGKGYCPFGILCEMSKVGSWEKQEEYDRYVYCNQDRYLPSKVTTWAGISDKEKQTLTAFIIHYNDRMKLPFSEIASLLEEKYTKNKP